MTIDHEGKMEKVTKKEANPKKSLENGSHLILAMLPIPWLSSTAKRDPLEFPALKKGRWGMRLHAEVDGFTPQKHVLTLPKFNSSPLKSYRDPRGKNSLPTTIFQGLYVKLRGSRWWFSNILPKGTKENDPI